MALYEKESVPIEGVVETPFDCTECKKQFVAKLDYDLNGNHEVVCPYCGHIHWRVIKNGVVTSDRWQHYQKWIEVSTTRVWSHKTEPIQTTSAAEHIRRKWGISS